jgi:RNA polymerase sigma-70 factor (ECF subfamily)
MGRKPGSDSTDQRPSMPLDNEHALIQRCRDGDVRAFEPLYHHYEGPMLAVAYRLLGSQEEAEDALQDSFLRLYRNIRRYRFDAAFSTWFYRIVVNICYDRLRKRKRAAHVALDAIQEMGKTDDAESRVHLQRAIDDLPPKMKACFVLHVQEGFKHRQIADMLGMKAETVRVHVFRAKAQLRNTLAPRLRGLSRDELP